MPQEPATADLITQLRAQMRLHKRTARLIDRTIRSLRRQQEVNAELVGLASTDRTVELMTEANRQLRGRSRSTEAKAASPASSTTPASAPPTPFTRIASPTMSLLRGFFGEGRLPSGTLEDELEALGKQTAPVLARGQLKKACIQLHLLDNRDSDQVPPYMTQLYKDLGLPDRWDQIREVLARWNVQTDAA